MKNKPIQYFTSQYLKNCESIEKEKIVEYLDQFQQLIGAKKSKSKAISLRIPENLLHSFKTKSDANGIPYQTQIIQLMKNWVSK
ncbi:MAG: hypothetical protein KA715_03060 [Xanthomonadaceae bacterium]|nr:hypothetical protein [Xanthomonadaceae bacterium]